MANRRRWKRHDPTNERGRVAVRYRAYPTPEQRQKARRIAGSCRVVKNLAKEQRDLAWRHGRHSVGYSAQSAALKELRDDPAVAPWLKEAPAQVLQQALRDTDAAYQRFFKGEGNYPTWTTKSGPRSFRDPQNVRPTRVSRHWGEVKLQGMGRVRVRLHRAPMGSRVCSATYTEEPDGKVFVSVLFERRKREPTSPRAPQGSEVGVDRGVAVAVATSDGELVDRDMWRPKERERLRRLERQRERQKPARQGRGKSKNQEKTERHIAALHARARRRRRDFCEQVSCDLAKNHRLVVFEDLHVAVMTRSANGTVEEPGKRVAQKAGLNRAVLDKGWGMLLARTTAKALRHGHRVVVVPAPGTSTTCPECTTVDPASRTTRSVFCCTRCGYTAHADVNAAVVIRERGKLALAGGTPVTARRGTNPEPEPSGAEPSASAGRGSGNQGTGCITDREAA